MSCNLNLNVFEFKCIFIVFVALLLHFIINYYYQHYITFTFSLEILKVRDYAFLLDLMNNLSDTQLKS